MLLSSQLKPPVPAAVSLLVGFFWCIRSLKVWLFLEEEKQNSVVIDHIATFREALWAGMAKIAQRIISISFCEEKKLR